MTPFASLIHPSVGLMKTWEASQWQDEENFRPQPPQPNGAKRQKYPRGRRQGWEMSFLCSEKTDLVLEFVAFSGELSESQSSLEVRPDLDMGAKIGATDFDHDIHDNLAILLEVRDQLLSSRR